MNKLRFALIILLVMAGASVFTSRQAQAASSGNESYEVNWRGTPAADRYQLWYGQTDTNRKDSTIYEGLDFRSQGVTIHNLKPCTQYSWNLLALRSGKWAWSWASDQTFTTGGVCPTPESGAVGTMLTTATGKKVTVTGTASAVATWSVVDGASQYNIYYRTAADTGYPHSAVVGPKTTSYTINYLNPAVKYFYKVCAVAGRKEVCGSEKVLYAPKAPVLGEKTSRRSSSKNKVLGAQVVGNETYEINWRGTAAADAYQVHYGQTDKGVKDSTIFEGLDFRSRSVTLYKLKPCTQYSWNLKVQRGGKWAWQWASDQTFTTGGVCPVKETGATGTKVTTFTGQKVVVTGTVTKLATWAPVDGAIQYNIYYRAAGDTGYPYSAVITSKTTSYGIGYLKAGTTYYYKVCGLTASKEVCTAEKML